MRTVFLILAIVLLLTAPAQAEQSTQTDWSGGGGTSGPLSEWGATFDSAADISWRAIPGQLALAGEPRAVPVKSSLTTSYPGAHGLYAIDFDQDGDIDVLGTTSTSNSLELWLNQGDNPVTWEHQTIDPAYTAAAAIHPVDMDGDGDTDVVAGAQHPGNDIYWFRNDGGSPVEWTKLPVGNYVPLVCNIDVADLDDDDDYDVLGTSWNSRYIAYWRNDGGSPPYFTRQTIRSNFNGAHSPYAADVDGDQDLDVVGTAASLNDVVLFINEGGDPIV